MLLRTFLDDYFYYVDCLNKCGNLIADVLTKVVSSVIPGVKFIHDSRFPRFTVHYDGEKRPTRQGTRVLRYLGLTGYMMRFMSLKNDRFFFCFDADSDGVYMSREESEAISDILRKKMRSTQEEVEGKTYSDLLDDYLYYHLRVGISGFFTAEVIDEEVSRIVPEAHVIFDMRELVFTVGGRLGARPDATILLQDVIVKALSNVDQRIGYYFRDSQVKIDKREALLITNYLDELLGLKVPSA